MYCRYCGTKVGSEQKHCTKCGSRQPLELAARETTTPKDAELSTITKMFVGICLVLMLITGLKMLGDDNYLGLTLVVLGFGSLIYGLLWWQNRRINYSQKSERNFVHEIGFEAEKLIAPGSEPISVTEEITRKIEATKLLRKQ